MATLEELERRIEAQEDLRAIERLQATYWDTLDAKDWEGLRACLVEDFVFVNNTTGGRYEGREGMLSTMRAKFAEGVTSSHQGHHHWIELTGEGTAVSHWFIGGRPVRCAPRRRVRGTRPLRQRVRED